MAVNGKSLERGQNKASRRESASTALGQVQGERRLCPSVHEGSGCLIKHNWWDGSHLKRAVTALAGANVEFNPIHVDARLRQVMRSVTESRQASEREQGGMGRRGY